MTNILNQGKKGLLFLLTGSLLLSGLGCSKLQKALVEHLPAATICSIKGQVSLHHQVASSGIKVTVSNTSQTLNLSTNTDASGHYMFLLEPDVYLLSYIKV